MELRITMPSRWLDLTAKQLLYVSRLFLMNYDTTKFLVKAFLFISGIKLQYDRDPEPDGARWFTHKSVKKPFLLDPDQVSEMAKSCEFLLSPDEVNPIRWIGFARSRQYRLYNATFEEYLMAENYYFAYIETKKDEHLDNLIACLYHRPWHWWNAAKIQKRALQFRNVDPAVKNSVFMWYIGFRTYVPKRCKTLFKSKGSGKKRRPFNPREYINGMIHQLNNGDITITDKLLKKPAWNALDELEQRAIDFEMAK